MKEKITQWLDEDSREYESVEHPNLRWLIELKHGDRMVLLGNPEENQKRLEVVYKLNVSDKHKEIMGKLDGNQRSGFEKALVMILAEDANIYNINRDEDNVPDSIVIKRHLYDSKLTKDNFFDTIQYVINMGMRTTIHFQSLHGANIQQKEVSSSRNHPSLYR